VASLLILHDGTGEGRPASLCPYKYHPKGMLEKRKKRERE